MNSMEQSHEEQCTVRALWLRWPWWHPRLPLRPRWRGRAKRGGVGPLHQPRRDPDWRADGDRVIYFQDSGRQWYRATLMTPAFDLPFVEAVGIQNSGTDRLDRWADVVVRGQHYPIQSFVKVDAPPVKSANAAHKS
jgi:hypothetical protein